MYNVHDPSYGKVHNENINRHPYPVLQLCVWNSNQAPCRGSSSGEVSVWRESGRRRLDCWEGAGGRGDVYTRLGRCPGKPRNWRGTTPKHLLIHLFIQPVDHCMRICTIKHKYTFKGWFTILMQELALHCMKLTIHINIVFQHMNGTQGNTGI